MSPTLTAEAVVGPLRGHRLGRLGAELDVDLAALTGTGIVDLRAVLVRHKVVCVRGQDLDPTEQVALARKLGRPTPAHPLAGGLDPDHPEILVLDSRSYALGLGRRTGTTSYNDRWHTDVTFSDRPPDASILCAEVIPPQGGDTLWSDQEDAFAALSPRLQEILRSTSAVHTAVGAFGFLEDQVARDADALDVPPPVRHPVVRIHPESGRPSLFVNEAFTDRLDGFTRAESEALLAFLHAHSTAEERTFRWQWQVGDVVIWDNRSTQHFAMADYDGHRRMRRVTLAGDVPIGPIDHLA